LFLTTFKIKIITDGGPWAQHNMPCAICHLKHAVYELENGHFHPCWDCQKEWNLKKINWLGKVFRK